MRRSAATTFLATCLAMGALATPANAHALLVRSDPAAGAELLTPPSRVVMTFTEDPDPVLSIVHVLDANGRPVEAGQAAAVPGAPRRLQIALRPNLPDGVYTVTWRTVSRQDGHVTASAFAFGVGASASPGAAAGTVVRAPSPSPVSVAGKVLLYVGLSLLFAAGAVGLGAFAARVPRRTLVLAGGWTSAAAGAVLMLVAERSSVGVGLGALFSSGAGHAYLWLLVAVALTGVVALVAWLRPSAWSLALVGIAASATMLVRADGGHASASPTSPLLQVGLQWVHFMSAGIWIGGIALASLLMLERRRADPPTDEIRRFSRIAGYSLGVVVLTGVLRALDERGGLSALGRVLTGSYGLALVIKVSVVAILIALGAYNRYRSIPRLDRGSAALRRTMAVELIAAVGVFGLTGTLTGLVPQPQVPQRPSVPPHITATGSDFATTVTVELTVAPGRPGDNAFAARVTNFDTGRPLDASGVTLTLRPVGDAAVGESSLALKRASEGRWTASGTNLSLAGVWNVTVVVQTGATSASVPLTLVALTSSPTVNVSTAAGQPDLYTFTFPGGQQIQAYNDPGAPGTNELHLTAFDAAGKELPLESATMVAIPPSGQAVSLRTRRFSTGHLVGDEQLITGRWTFFLEATARDGTVLMASFRQTI